MSRDRGAPPPDAKIDAVAGPQYDRARKRYRLRWLQDDKPRAKATFRTEQEARDYAAQYLHRRPIAPAAVPHAAAAAPGDRAAVQAAVGDATQQIVMAEQVQARAVEMLDAATLTLEELERISRIVKLQADTIARHRNPRETTTRLEQLEQQMRGEKKAKKYGRSNQRAEIPQARVVRRGEELKH